MDGLPAHSVVEYMSPDRLPPEAVELFGNEVRDAWGGDPALPQPVSIGVTTDGEWMAGILMYLETLEPTAGGQPSRVASIKHLIVRPTYRSRGLAGRLLRRAMNLAAQTGCVRIRSTAGFGCPDHAVLYDRLRFRRAPSTDRPYLVTRDLAS